MVPLRIVDGFNVLYNDILMISLLSAVFVNVATTVL